MSLNAFLEGAASVKVTQAASDLPQGGFEIQVIPFLLAYRR